MTPPDLAAQVSYICNNEGLVTFDFEADDTLLARIGDALSTLSMETLLAAGVSDPQCYRPSLENGTATALLDVIEDAVGFKVEETRQMAQTLDSQAAQAVGEGMTPVTHSVLFIWTNSRSVPTPTRRMRPCPSSWPSRRCLPRPMPRRMFTCLQRSTPS